MSSVTLKMGPDCNEVRKIGSANARRSIVGATVEQVVNDPSINAVYEFTGREVYQVQQAGDTEWEQVDGDYVLQDGDTLRFEKASGEKGK